MATRPITAGGHRHRRRKVSLHPVVYAMAVNVALWIGLINFGRWLLSNR